MKTLALLGIMLCAVVCSAGCFFLDERPAATVAPTTVPVTATSTPSEATVSTLEPAAMALQLSDLPSGYIIRERADIPYSDASQFAREKGWQKGYKVSFYRMDAEKYDITSISQQVDIYHIDNIHLVDSAMKIIFDQAEDDILAYGNDTVTVTELPFPKTGDQTSAYRIADSNNTYGIMRYVVVFTDKNVIEAIEMKGTTTDYEVLKGIAAEAAGKIQ